MTEPTLVARPAATALLLVDMQNDFMHPQGAYARGGMRLDAEAAIGALSMRLPALRAAGVLIVGILYTVPVCRGQPQFRRGFQERQGFLRSGDFAPGSFGHAIDERLAPVDMAVEKVLPSAFFQSRLHHQLGLAGIDTLLIAGITTTNGVAATVHDARQLGYETYVLGDCCAARTQQLHEAALCALDSPDSPVVDSASLVFPADFAP